MDLHSKKERRLMSKRRREAKRVLFTNCHSETSSSESSLEYEDVLERKIEELSRHLAEEKQVSKREKIHVARLHRELARYKGDKEVKEKDSILKDLERERMLRTEAEKRLRELSAETSHSQARFQQLQTEFQKMEQAVSQMMQFKSKIDQLKQEKTSLSMQYENNIQKCNTHISSLERENIMLLNDVKKFEQQMSSGTDQERTQLLLERLKVLEAENSSLVLENEQQRQQYEKCLDEIANQVVQALLAQKTLREECLQLQTRVQDLEHQNKELNHMFQQKVKYSSDTLLQTLPASQTVSTSTLCESSGYYNSVCSLPASSVSIEAMHISATVAHCNIDVTQPDLPLNHHSTVNTSPLHPVANGYQLTASTNTSPHPVAMGYHPSASTDSSQLSVGVSGHLSTSNDSLHSDNAFEDPKSSKCNSKCGANCDNVQCRTKIETEFPATNSSPKMKHVSISERSIERTKQRSNSTSSLNTASKLRTFRSNSTNAAMSKSRLVQPGVISQSSSSSNVAQGQIDNVVHNQSESSTKKRSLSQPEHINKSMLHVSQTKPGSKPVRSELSKSTSKINPKLQKSSSSSNIPMKKTSKSQSSLPQPSQSKLPQKKTEIDSGKRNSGVVSLNSRVPKTVTSTKTQGALSSKQNQTRIQTEMEHKQREVTPINTGTSRVPSIPNGQYFYDYSDEDSDINRPVSGVSNGSTASVNEILDDDYDTDTLLDANFTTEKFAFFETPQFHKDDKKKDKCKKKKDKSMFSSLRGKPDIVKDTEHSEQKNKIKSPRPHRRRGSLPHSLKSKVNRPSSLVICSKDKSNMQHAYSSSSLSSTDSDENYMPHLSRQYQLKYKTRNQSGSSETNSMSGSQSEKVQMKSSQESTPTGGEKSFMPPNEQNIYREVIVVKNNENSHHGTQPNRKPPPPVPKKPPVAGRRSPGIIMGVQSPGLRIKTQGHDLGVLRPHEFKTGVFESTDSVSSVPIPTVIVPSDANVTQTHKYMSSDSSFESVKNEKVERSGSKDDGYSTMSSDIQPEMMEKFSDSSLKRDTILRCDLQIRNDITVAQETSQKFIPCNNSVIDTGSVAHSQPNTSPKRTVPQVHDRSIGNGSLGRVKAMRQMFEAQCEQANDHLKPFPLRKSYSVDSKLGHKESPSHNVNRRSLGEDVMLNVSVQEEEKYGRGLNSEQVDKCREQAQAVTCDQFMYESHHSNITQRDEQGHFVSSLDHVTLSSDHVTSSRNHITDHTASRSHMTADRNSIYHMLNLSEENFLSDIPEEREDYGEMSGASNEKLLDFPMRPQAAKLAHITKLQKFETTVKKFYWSSTSGLCRFLSDSDLDKIMRRDSFEDITKHRSGRPLERSVSLSALNTRTEMITNMRLAPTLRRSCHHSLINEISVNDRVQDIVKEHILKQLARSVDSESDDDLHNYSFAQLLAKKQRQNFLEQSFESKFNQPIRGKQRSDFPDDPLSSDFHGNKEDFLFQEERGDERGRQSSKESSPMIEQPSKFRSDYYSLCMVGSNRSLFSGSNEGESEQVQTEETKCTGCKDPSKCANCTKAKNSEEFEQISKQLQSLSKTVTALQQTFNGVDSCDSDEESNEDHSHMFVSPNSDFHGDGYQWIEDDEFYLTPCGGELIMGASPFSDTGACAEWINEYADDTSCNDEFEFYGNFASENVTDHQFQPPIKEEDETQRHPELNGVPPSAQSSQANLDRNMPVPCDSYSRQRGLRRVEGHGHPKHHSEGHLPSQPSHHRKELIREPRERTENNRVLDPQARAAMLDAMVHLSGASMDSLDDNIGVDHVMCSRLIGGAEKAVVKQTAVRSAVDLSQFFTRYGEPEQEAVAAFDFLNEVPVDPLEQATSLMLGQSNAPLQNSLNESANPCSAMSHGSQNKLSSQSQMQPNANLNEAKKKGPEIHFKPVVKVKQEVQGNSPSVQKSQEMQGNSQSTQKPQDVKGTDNTKSKISKPEKKFFNFSRSKLSKSSDTVKDKDSKLPKKVKGKDKETPKDKEKSKIPKFARSSSVEHKTTKQLSAKNIQENGKAGSLKYFHPSSNDHASVLKMNSKIVDKL